MSSPNLFNFIDQSSKQDDSNLVYCQVQQTQKDNQGSLLKTLSKEDVQFYTTLMEKVKSGKVLLMNYQLAELYKCEGFYLRKDGTVVLQHHNEEATW